MGSGCERHPVVTFQQKEMHMDKMKVKNIRLKTENQTYLKTNKPLFISSKT